jgi:hypothetical protein
MAPLLRARITTPSDSPGKKVQWQHQQMMGNRPGVKRSGIAHLHGIHQDGRYIGFWIQLIHPDIHVIQQGVIQLQKPTACHGVGITQGHVYPVRRLGMRKDQLICITALDRPAAAEKILGAQGLFFVLGKAHLGQRSSRRLYRRHIADRADRSQRLGQCSTRNKQPRQGQQQPREIHAQPSVQRCSLKQNRGMLHQSIMHGNRLWHDTLSRMLG